MISRNFFRLFTFSIIIFFGSEQGLLGQVGTVQHHSAGQPLLENLFSYHYAPLCVGETFYSLVGEDNKKHPLKMRYVLNAFERRDPKAVVTRELQFSADADEKFNVRGFFIANGAPSVLYRLWNKETGLVKLYAVSYDPKTLEPLSSPKQIGEIPFEPRNHIGNGPQVQIESTTTGDKILFYFDQIRSGEIQLVMCWVTDASFVSDWSAIYKVPVHPYGSDMDMHFSDDGAVYLNVTAVLLTEANTEERADGTIDAEVKYSDFQHKQMTIFKLYNEEFEQWKCDLGPDRIHSIQIDIVGRTLWFGALVSRSDKGFPNEWVIGRLGTDFLPSIDHRFLVKKNRTKPTYVKQLVMDMNGGGHIIGGIHGLLFVCAFDGSGEELYQVTMNGSFNLSISTLSDRGRLFMGLVASAQDRAKSDELQLKTTSTSLFPVLVAINETGKVKVDQLINKEDGGQRELGYVQPDFEGIQRCGYFIDFSYDKKRPGLISVPISF